MKSANTTHILSFVTGFQARILERNGMKLLACIFCAALGYAMISKVKFGVTVKVLLKLV